MSLQTARPAPRRDDTADRMADFITRPAASAGGVTRDDLLLDFDENEIDAHFDKAKKLARNAGKAARQ